MLDTHHPEPARILLAEDNPELRELIRHALVIRGFEVEEATEGPALAASLAREPDAFDLVITGLRLPGESGLEVLAKLREHDWTLPVIVISAFGNLDQHLSARRLGAARVFDEPFDLDALADAASTLAVEM